MAFRDPQALSSALAVLGTLQPRTFGSLNAVDPLVLSSNYYLNALARVTSSMSSSKSMFPLKWGRRMLHPPLKKTSSKFLMKIAITLFESLKIYKDNLLLFL